MADRSPPDGQLHIVQFDDGATIELDYDATTGSVTDLRGGDTAFPMHYSITSDTFGQPLHIGDASASLVYDYDVTMPARETSAGPADRHGVVRWNVGSALMLESEQITLGTAASSTTATLAYDYDADAVLRTVHLATAATSTTTSVEYRRGAPPVPPAAPTIWTPVSVVTTTPTGASSTTAISVTPFGELSQLSTSPSSGAGPWYETEICARDSQGRITDRREFLPVTPTGHGSATRPRFVFHHFEYDAAGRLHRDRAYSRAATETCISWLAFFASSPGARADLSDQTMAYTENGGLLSGAHADCSSIDAADRPTCPRGRTYNPRGQLTSLGHGDTVAYDVLGRIRSFRRGSTSITYEWDPASRLAHIGGSRSDEEHFVYDGARAVAWRRGNDTSFFVYGSMGHVPDLMYRDLGTNGSIDETYRLVTDERGSVRLVIRLDGPTAGMVAQRIDYDAWGWPTLVAGDARLQPFGFAGGTWLSDAQLWRFGARDYDPSIGAWTAGDPIGFAAGENQYAYCAGDPVNCIDPTGLESFFVQFLEVLENIRIIVQGEGSVTIEEAAGAVAAGEDLGVPGQQGLARQIARAAGQGAPVLDRGHALNQTIGELGRGRAARFGQPHYHPTDASGNRLRGVGHVFFSFGLAGIGARARITPAGLAAAANRNLDDVCRSIAEFATPLVFYVPPPQGPVL